MHGSCRNVYKARKKDTGELVGIAKFPMIKNMEALHDAWNANKECESSYFSRCYDIIISNNAIYVKHEDRIEKVDCYGVLQDDSVDFYLELWLWIQ